MALRFVFRSLVAARHWILDRLPRRCRAPFGRGTCIPKVLEAICPTTTQQSDEGQLTASPEVRPIFICRHLQQVNVFEGPCPGRRIAARGVDRMTRGSGVDPSRRFFVCEVQLLAVPLLPSIVFP